MAVPLDKVDYIAFNNFHPRLQFTLEFGGKKIFRHHYYSRSKQSKNDWYHKRFPVEFLITGLRIRCLKKRSTIMRLADRAFSLSHLTKKI